MTTMGETEIRERLEQELRVTATRLRERGWLAHPERLSEVIPPEGPMGDTFDRIEALESREQDLASRERLAERLDRIVEALQRLRDGSYGTCSACGGPIGLARLRAIPEATLCIGCQEELEPGRGSQRTVRAFYSGTRSGSDGLDED